jgi:cell division protein FtsZ
VSLPISFAFEGSQRERIAQEGLVKLKDKVDALIVVPNDRIFTIISKDTPILKAFEAIDGILRNALRGIVELIVSPGIINVDFADVRSIMQDAGSAIVGVGIASGPERAVHAVQQAMSSPLLEVTAEGAKGVLLGVSGGRDMRMNEINEAAKIVAQAADPGARIIFGAYHDRHLKPNQLKITLVATGFNGTASNSLFTSTSYFGQAKKELMDEVKMPMLRDDMRGGKEGREEPMLAPRQGQGVPVREGIYASQTTKEKEELVKKKETPKPDVWDIPTFLRKKRK